MKFRRLTGFLALAALLTACGSSSSNTSSGTNGPGKQASIAGELPSGMKSIAVATDATYAPNEYINPDTGQIVGWEIDLGKAISQVLGIPFNFSNADFNSIIPDLGTRYEMGISSFSPTTDREKTVDFVTYYKAGEIWLVTTTGGVTMSGTADMCGKTVAVETGTTEELDAWGYMGKKPDGSAIPGDKDQCKAAGKADISVLSFTKQTDANTALYSGRAQVGFLDTPVAAYQVKTSRGRLKLTGKPCSVAPYGIAVPKNSGLAKPLQDAVKFLIDNGYYKTILTNWNVQDGAVSSSGVGLNVNSLPGQPACATY